MGKIKDILSRVKLSPFAKFAIIVLAIFLFSWLFGPGNTFPAWIRAKVDIARLDRQIEDYKSKTEQMDSRIRELKSNRDSLERFAREKFLFSAPGEDVYVLEAE